MRQTFDERFNCLYGKVSETYINVTGFALFGHCHYLLTIPRTYYIRMLLYDIVIVTLRFSHCFHTKCIGYYVICIGTHRI